MKLTQPLIAQHLQDELELLSPPGATILETLQEQELNRTRFAIRMGLTFDVSQLLIKGILPITPAIAERLEKVLKIDKQFWISRENNYRKKLDEIVKQIS